jgi:hypothetical protein
MTKYKFKMKDDGYKNTLEFESDDLGDVIANMELFLKGCGFIFDGALDIHTGEVEKNAMHYVYKMKYREREDVVNKDDDLGDGFKND